MRDELESLKDSEWSIVFYESPHRIHKTLLCMKNIFGDRIISISKEISKLHESVYVGKISDVIDSELLLKGEFVIIVSPKKKIINNDMSILDNVNMYIRSGLSSMEAIKRVAKERKISKNDVYMEFHRGDKL